MVRFKFISPVRYRSLSSYKTHHKSAFSFIKRVRRNIKHMSQVKCNETTNDLDYVNISSCIKCVKSPSLSELQDDVNNLYTESYIQTRRITPMSRMYSYKSKCVYH